MQNMKESKNNHGASFSKIERLKSAFTDIWDNSEANTKLEKNVQEMFELILEDPDTTIIMDIIGKRYYVKNENEHFTAIVVSASSIIRLINTKNSYDIKFKPSYVNLIIKKIVQSNFERMNVLDKEADEKLIDFTTEFIHSFQKNKQERDDEERIRNFPGHISVG